MAKSLIQSISNDWTNEKFINKNMKKRKAGSVQNLLRTWLYGLL